MKGSVFSWGRFANGRLGHGILPSARRQKIRSLSRRQVPRFLLFPKRIDRLKGTRISSICAGESHAHAVDEDGNLYSWGSARCGQLGLGETGDQLFPVKVEEFRIENGALITDDDVVIKHVCAGATHSMAGTVEGDLYTWGGNGGAMLGLSADHHGDTAVVRSSGALVKASRYIDDAEDDETLVAAKLQEMKKLQKEIRKLHKQCRSEGAVEDSSASVAEESEDEGDVTAQWVEMKMLDFEYDEQAELQRVADQLQRMMSVDGGLHMAPQQCYVTSNLESSGVSFTSMIDTGANTVVVMEEEVYESMRREYPLDFEESEFLRKPVRARTAGKGSSVSLHKTGRVKHVFMGTPIGIDVVLMRGGSTGAAMAMIGNDFCFKRKCVLDFDHKTFSIKVGDHGTSIMDIPMESNVPMGTNGKALMSPMASSYLQHVQTGGRAHDDNTAGVLQPAVVEQVSSGMEPVISENGVASGASSGVTAVVGTAIGADKPKEMEGEKAATVTHTAAAVSKPLLS